MSKDKGFLRWDPGQPSIPKGVRIEVSQLTSYFPLPHNLEVGLGDSFSSMRCAVDYTEYPGTASPDNREQIQGLWALHFLPSLELSVKAGL